MPPTPLSSWLVLFPWAETATVAFAFIWGAMLGSFLNVVAHRVPRGESVVRGRSRCPRCGAAVRARDNVPVLGWLLLRGRCRDCAEPIAARYPLVELLCGLLVAATAAADLLQGGLDRVLLLGEWLPPARFCFHSAALLAAVTWWLLTTAGARVSWVTVLLALTATGLAIAAVPALQPVGVMPAGGAWPEGHPRLAAAAAWLAGTVAGLAAASWLGRAGSPLPLLGAAFGWQTVTIVTVLAAVGRKLRRRPPTGGLTPRREIQGLQGYDG